MATARQMRIEFLEKIGMSEKQFNHSVRTMVAKDCLRAEGKLAKKRKSRRAIRNWKQRKAANG